MAHGNGRVQREHRPQDLGPRIEYRGRYASADLRPWGGRRYTPLRDPGHPRWPNAGDKTEDEDIARQWSWAYVRDLQQGKRAKLLGTPTRGRKLQQAADEWLLHRQRSTAHNTYSSSRTAVRHLVEWAGKDRSTDDLGAELLQALFDDLAEHEYAITTLDTYRNSLGAFFEWLGFGAHNPARAVELPDPGEQDIEAPTDEQLVELRKAADAVDRNRRGRSPSARVAVEVGLGMGLRQQEMFALDWRAINAAARTVHVTRQLVKDGRGFKPLKSKEGRTAIILPEFWPYHRPGATGLVLCNRDGSVVGGRSRAQRDLIQRTLDTAGLNAPGRGWHWLRHGYARLCLERHGISYEELQLFLGHANVIITQKAYGHFGGNAATDRARSRVYPDGAGRVLQVVREG